MKPADLIYPVLLLVCIFASVAVARFDGKRTIVAQDGTNRQLQHKVNWRRNHHIVTFHEGSKRSPTKGQGSKQGLETKKVSPEKGAKEKPSTQPTPTHPTTKKTEVKTTTNTTTRTEKPGPGGSEAGGPYAGVVTDFVDMKTIFFLLIGITFAIIGCFIFRVVRSRSRRKTKKYGVLATRGNEVELTPLEQDDEDEDMTVFDVNST